MHRSGFTKLIRELHHPQHWGLPIVFRFLLLAFAGATVVSVANSKKDFALLAGTFLVGLGALEAVMHVFGG